MAKQQNWIGVAKNWESRSSNPLDNLISLNVNQLRTHLLAIGSTGSGKTTLLQHLIAQDIERGHSIVVVDLRGDLVESVINMCSASNVAPERISLIDLRAK